MNDKEYKLWLCTIEKIGNVKISKLLEHFNTPQNVFEADINQLTEVDGIGEKYAKIIEESKETFDYKRVIKELKNNNMNYVTLFDKEYPKKLENVEDKPAILYYIGELPKAEKSISIVGARYCSDYGIECAKYFARELSSLGIDIISGMARGIDGWAHQGALEGAKKTYAILGCGANICYPKEHIRLYESIVKNGGIISEYPPNTRALSQYFPMRNRIISGLADGVLVIEAKKKSGSLITADFAMNGGKDVFVVPGRIYDSLSMGCNELIKQGAMPVTNVGDILDRFGMDGEKIEEKLLKSKIILERKEKMVYAIVCLEPTHLTSIMDNTDLSQSETVESLRSLMRKGLIRETGSNYYVRTNL